MDVTISSSSLMKEKDLIRMRSRCSSERHLDGCCHRNGKQNVHCASLSRFPMSECSVLELDDGLLTNMKWQFCLCSYFVERIKCSKHFNHFLETFTGFLHQQGILRGSISYDLEQFFWRYGFDSHASGNWSRCIHDHTQLRRSESQIDIESKKQHTQTDASRQYYVTLQWTRRTTRSMNSQWFSRNSWKIPSQKEIFFATLSRSKHLQLQIAPFSTFPLAQTW